MTQGDETKKSFGRRILTRTATIGTTLVVVGVAAGIVIFGRGVLAERAADVELPEAAPIVTAAVAPLALEDGFETHRRFAGQVQAGQRTVMAFEAAGEVAEVMVDEGARILAGEPVARLDTRLLEAERERLVASRAAMEAQAELARRTSDRQAALRERGHASSQALDDVTLRLAEATARIAEMNAALAAIDVRLDKSVLTAPFDADVAERMIDTGSMAAPGAPVVSLVEADRRRFRVGLSPEAAGSLEEGRIFEAKFGDRVYSVALTAILPELDPSTRTRVAMFDFTEGEAPPLRATGELSLSTMRASSGAWAPVSALRDGPQGLWLITTVRRTEIGDVASVEAVEIIHAETERAFVRGTFQDGDLVVVDGAHRIAPGQIVSPVPAAGGETFLSIASAETE